MILKHKILQCIDKDGGLSSLSDKLGMSQNVLVSIAKWWRRKYRKNILDTLYKHFDIKKDKFYRDNLKKRYPKTISSIGTFIRLLRINKGMDIDEFSRAVGVDKRALLRLECGDSLPTENSYTLNEVLNVLECSKKQRRVIKEFVRWYKAMEIAIRDLEKRHW